MLLLSVCTGAMRPRERFVDYLAQHADFVVRYNGGNNAGPYGRGGRRGLQVPCGAGRRAARERHPDHSRRCSRRPQGSGRRVCGTPEARNQHREDQDQRQCPRDHALIIGFSTPLRTSTRATGRSAPPVAASARATADKMSRTGISNSRAHRSRAVPGARRRVPALRTISSPRSTAAGGFDADEIISEYYRLREGDGAVRRRHRRDPVGGLGVLRQYPLRGRARNAAGHRPRHVSVRDQFPLHLRRHDYRHRRRAHDDRPRGRHRKGLHDAGGGGALSD